MKKTLAFIVERLAQIRQCPMMWGSLEVVEFTTLQCIEIEAHLLGKGSNRDVLEAWQKRIRDLYPEGGRRYMYAMLPHAKESYDTLLNAMALFREQLLGLPFPMWDTSKGAQRLRMPTRGETP